MAWSRTPSPISAAGSVLYSVGTGNQRTRPRMVWVARDGSTTSVRLHLAATSPTLPLARRPVRGRSACASIDAIVDPPRRRHPPETDAEWYGQLAPVLVAGRPNARVRLQTCARPTAVRTPTDALPRARRRTARRRSCSCTARSACGKRNSRTMASGRWCARTRRATRGASGPDACTATRRWWPLGVGQHFAGCLAGRPLAGRTLAGLRDARGGRGREVFVTPFPSAATHPRGLAQAAARSRAGRTAAASCSSRVPRRL
jgi:hypothetical protein